MVAGIARREDVATRDAFVEAGFEKGTALAGPGAVDVAQALDGVGGGLPGGEPDNIAWGGISPVYDTMAGYIP